jgi:hypothetical protein
MDINFIMKACLALVTFGAIKLDNVIKEIARAPNNTPPLLFAIAGESKQTAKSA